MTKNENQITTIRLIPKRGRPVEHRVDDPMLPEYTELVRVGTKAEVLVADPAIYLRDAEALLDLGEWRWAQLVLLAHRRETRARLVSELVPPAQDLWRRLVSVERGCRQRAREVTA